VAFSFPFFIDFALDRYRCLFPLQLVEDHLLYSAGNSRITLIILFIWTCICAIRSTPASWRVSSCSCLAA